MMMTLQEALERFLAAKPRSASTKRQYRHSLGMHFRFLEERKGSGCEVTSVTTEDTEAWVADMCGRGLSVWTVNGRIKDAKAFWAWLLREKLIASSPAVILRVKRFKPNRIRKIAISDQDLERLLERAKAKSVREYAIARFIADTGCRRAAVAHLRLSQLDLDEGFATLLGKGDKFYDVSLTERTQEALRAYLAERPTVSHDYVFVSEKEPHGPLTEEGVSSLWRRLTEDGEFDSRHNMHALRHNFTSRLARKGVNMAYIQEALGHEDMETTRLYVQVCMETMKEIVESVSVM